jgi:sugar fermentation stimulation protein A
MTFDGEIPSRLVPARFLKRDNRFVAVAEYGGGKGEIYVPNTGRLSELLVPGAELLLEPHRGKFSYRLAYVIYRGYPVAVESVRANSIVARFLERKELPGYEEYTLVAREPSLGNHRFDLLLKGPRGEAFMEIKSCTLARGAMGSFPDAVSERASRHVEALSGTGDPHLVFLSFHPPVTRFMPNVHTDYRFYRALAENRDRITIRAFSVTYDEFLEVSALTGARFILPDVDDRGILLHLVRGEQGYGLAVVPVLKDMLSMERSGRSLFSSTGEKLRRVQLLPIRGMENINSSRLSGDCMELEGAREDRALLGGEEVDLIWLPEDPRKNPSFWDLVLSLRFDPWSQDI